MRSSAEQTQLLAFLIELIGATRVLEIGCFTGYGALGHGAGAATRRPSGHARRQRPLAGDRAAPLGERRRRRPDRAAGGPGARRARRLCATKARLFDLAYVDADKKLYDDYYERALALVRPGGVVALDNVLWGGAVADPADDDRQTLVLRALNAKIRADERVSAVLLPVGDGLTAGAPALTRAQLLALRSSWTSCARRADIDRTRDQRLADDEAGRAVDAQALGQRVVGVEPLLDPGGFHLGGHGARVVAVAPRPALSTAVQAEVLGLHQGHVEVVVLAVVELGRRQCRLGRRDRIGPSTGSSLNTKRSWSSVETRSCRLPAMLRQ